MTNSRDRDITVTGFPVLIYAEEDSAAEAELWSHGKRVPLAIVPPGIAAAIAQLDKKALKRLDNRFGKLPDSQVAKLVAHSKVLDAARLRDVGKMREYFDWLRVADSKLPRPPTKEAQGRAILAAYRKHVIEQIKGSDERLIAWAEEHSSDFLELARPIMFHYRGQLEPQLGLLVRTFNPEDGLSVALGVQLILDTQGSSGLSYCARCDKPYIRTKQGQQFCSLKCGNNERQARRRAKIQGREK
jgi:hypothetical protein